MPVLTCDRGCGCSLSSRRCSHWAHCSPGNKAARSGHTLFCMPSRPRVCTGNFHQLCKITLNRLCSAILPMWLGYDFGVTYNFPYSLHPMPCLAVFQIGMVLMDVVLVLSLWWGAPLLPIPLMPLWSCCCNSQTFPISFCLRMSKAELLLAILPFTLGSQNVATLCKWFTSCGSK